jgi:hypothetical protein
VLSKRTPSLSDYLFFIWKHFASAVPGHIFADARDSMQALVSGICRACSHLQSLHSSHNRLVASGVEDVDGLSDVRKERKGVGRLCVTMMRV